MTELAVPEIDRALAHARRHFAAGGTTVAFVGPPTAGKSSALRHLAREMATGLQRRRLVEIAFPQLGEDDAAMVALANAAAQLGGDDTAMQLVRNPKIAFGAKVDRVLAELEKADNLLVTIDAPPLRHAPGPTMGMFQEAEWTTFHRLASLRTPLVAIAANRGSTLPDAKAIRLHASSDPSAILSPEQWNGLGSSAARAQTVFGARLRHFSPQIVRLAVAAIHLKVPEDRLERVTLGSELLDVVLSVLSEDARIVLARLGQVRGPFDEALLDAVDWQEMRPHEQAALHGALLLSDQGALHLHEDIARRVRARHSDEAFIEGHRALAEWHRGHYEVASNKRQLRETIRHELELVHHLTQCGDEEALDHAYFVEQYDVLGKSLSRAKRHGEAVDAYERAVEHQAEEQGRPEHAYAHHYLAYNLDIEGREPERVDRHYARARELDDQHVWYHGRRLCYLVVRGRDAEAREGWVEANAAFVPDDESSDELYRQLHGYFARVLLHRGRVSFAHEVLGAVSSSSRKQPWWLELRRYERGLTDAKQRHLVFPPHLEDGERWEGPHLAPRRGVDAIVRWMPACVDDADDEGVSFRVAVSGEPEPSYGYRRMSWAELETAGDDWGSVGFPNGTFAEIYELEGGKLRIERWPEQKRSGDLLRVFPRPDRYIRRALAKTTE